MEKLSTPTPAAMQRAVPADVLSRVDTWTAYNDGEYWRCSTCKQGILPLSHKGVGYHYPWQAFADAVRSHVIRVHRADVWPYAMEAS